VVGVRRRRLSPTEVSSPASGAGPLIDSLLMRVPRLDPVPGDRAASFGDRRGTHERAAARCDRRGSKRHSQFGTTSPSP
jgi:hypothetical protein